MSRPPVHGSHSRWPVGTILVVGLLAVSGCSGEGVDLDGPVAASSGDPDARAQRAASRLEQAGLGTLASALREVDLDEVVEGDAFTLFAPDDEAFQSLTADELADLTSDSELLIDMLRDHVVAEAITTDDLSDMSEVTTTSGETLEVATEDGTVTIGGAEVLDTLELDGTGVVHVVDSLLVRE